MLRTVQTQLARTSATVVAAIFLMMMDTLALVSPNIRIVIFAPFIFKILLPIDIDECARKTDNCSQNCRNTPGLYECSCDVGYELGSDSRTCQG